MRVGDTVKIQNFHPNYNGQKAELVWVAGSYVLVRLRDGSLLELLETETSAASVDTLW